MEDIVILYSLKKVFLRRTYVIMKAFRVIMACTIAATSIAALSGCQAAKKTVSCKELFDPQFTGLSGKAYYEGYSTSEKRAVLEKQLLGNVNTSKMSYSQQSEYNEAVNILESFFRSFDYSVIGSKDSDEVATYKNGDELKVKVTYSEKAAEVLNINVTDTEFNYKIEGLEEGTKVNPFDNLKVTFTGISGDGEVLIDKSDCHEFVKDEVYFQKGDNNGELKNGDTLTITASYSEYDATRSKIVITETSKEYKVSGLTSYPDNISECDLSELNSEMDRLETEQINEHLKKGDSAYVNDSYESFTIDSVTVTPFRYYYGELKDESWFYSHNVYYAVYEVKLQGKIKYDSSKYKKGQTVTSTEYYYASYSNLVVDDNKKAVFESDNISANYYGSYNSLKELEKAFNESSDYNYTIVK